MSLNQVNQFACEHCRDDRDFEQDEFQSIEDAVRRVREQVSLITVCAFFVTTYSGKGLYLLTWVLHVKTDIETYCMWNSAIIVSSGTPAI